MTTFERNNLICEGYNQVYARLQGIFEWVKEIEELLVFTNAREDKKVVMKYIKKFQNDLFLNEMRKSFRLLMASN